MGTAGAKAFGDVLRVNKTLQHLNVSNNSFGKMQVGDQVKLKSSGEMCTVYLAYSDGRIWIIKPDGSKQDYVTPSEFEPIPAVLPLKKLRDNTITELVFKNSGLGVDGGMMLAAVLKNNRSVTKVSDDVWLV